MKIIIIRAIIVGWESDIKTNLIHVAGWVVAHSTETKEKQRILIGGG